MNEFMTVLKKYAVFTGRARRREYWMYILFYAIIVVALTVIGGLIHFPLIVSLFELAVLVPTIAVGIRRMHDVGKSGWFSIIPIYNLVLAATPGVAGANNYGPDPKQEAAPAAA